MPVMIILPTNFLSIPIKSSNLCLLGDDREHTDVVGAFVQLNGHMGGCLA